MTMADLNAMDPAIWPASATRNDAGELVVGGVSVVELAREYGTPLYVYDEADVRQRARDYVRSFSADDITTRVYYAGKSFLTTAVARWVSDEGLGVDVCSAGELAVALRAGVPVWISGVTKSMRWATSDHHWGHRNILRYCAATRPFPDVDEMNAQLIARWNEP